MPRVGDCRAVVSVDLEATTGAGVLREHSASDRIGTGVGSVCTSTEQQERSITAFSRSTLALRVGRRRSIRDRKDHGMLVFLEVVLRIC